MKILFILSISIFTLLIASCIPIDPCSDIECENGYCVDGTCICDGGYEGTYCQLRTAPDKPTGFKITRVDITNFPLCFSDGTKIDNEPSPGDRPDLRVEMVNSSIGTYTTPQTYNDSNVDFSNLDWSANNSQSTSTTIKIYDRDDLGAVSVDDLLVSIGFDLDALEAEPDNAYSTQIQSGFSDQCYPYGSQSWVRVYFELIY